MTQVQTLATEDAQRILHAALALAQAMPVLPQDGELEAALAIFLEDADKGTPDLGRLRAFRDQALAALSRITEGGAGGALGNVLLELIKQPSL